MAIRTSAQTHAKSAGPELSVSAHDRKVLRHLAGRVAELAARPGEAQKRELWYRHNDLEATRPLVFCDPENGWNEIITRDQLQCAEGLARRWEMVLRKEIFWGETMGDDRVVEPFFTVFYVAHRSDWGMRETRIGGQNGGSYVWDAPLKSYDDLDQLRFPTIDVNQEATDSLVSFTEELLGDLLTVQLRGFWWWSHGLTQTCILLRGLEQMMLDICLYPEELKQLMAFLRDGTMAQLDFLEKEGLLSPNHEGTYVGSGGFGYTRELPQEGFNKDSVRLRDMWGFCESQETTSVSPEHFAEFVFEFQRPILERFGLNSYGCCEPLDLRWDIVKQTPRLRRVSVSPWSSLEGMADRLTDQYVFSMKPNPASLATPSIDEDSIRAGLRRAFEITRNCRVEVIMKDNHTIGRNPQNVIRWCRIAKEEAEAAGC